MKKSRGRPPVIPDPVRLELTVDRSDLRRLARIERALQAKGKSQTLRRLLAIMDRDDAITQLTEYAPRFVKVR